MLQIKRFISASAHWFHPLASTNPSVPASVYLFVFLSGFRYIYASIDGFICRHLRIIQATLSNSIQALEGWEHQCDLRRRHPRNCLKLKLQRIACPTNLPTNLKHPNQHKAHEKKHKDGPIIAHSKHLQVYVRSTWWCHKSRWSK